MAKKLINRILGENRVGSKISEQDLIDYSIGAFLTDEENRTVWINGMPYGNAYISSSEIRQPKHAEVFNNFDNNKAEGHYSHVEGGTYVNTVYNNTKIAFLEPAVEGYSYSVPYTSVLYKMIQVMANKNMNIPLYVVINNESRLDLRSEDETSNDETSNDVITNYDTENTLLAIDKYDNAETPDYDGPDAQLENKVTSAEPTKYYIKNYKTDTDKKVIYFNVAKSLEPTAELEILPPYCIGKTMYFHYYYAYDGKDGWSEATKDGAHAEGVSQARGVMSHAEGFANRSYEDYSHTEGVGNEVYGLAAHAEGDRNIVTNSAPYSHAEGHMNIAKADSVHVEGRNNLGNNTGAHVEGGRNKVDGLYGHAEGYGNTVNNENSHAEGTNTVNNGKSSHTEGVGTITTNEGEHAEGTYNYSDDGYISSIGIGSNNETRKNAITVLKDGRIYLNETSEIINDISKKFNPCLYDGKVVNDNSKSLQQILANIENKIELITYTELKNYINTNSLTPGKFYEIKDYSVLYNTNSNLRFAGHKFNIIVFAISPNLLAESAFVTYPSIDINTYDFIALYNETKKIDMLDTDSKNDDILSNIYNLYNKNNKPIYIYEFDTSSKTLKKDGVINDSSEIKFIEPIGNSNYVYMLKYSDDYTYQIDNPIFLEYDNVRYIYNYFSYDYNVNNEKTNYTNILNINVLSSNCFAEITALNIQTFANGITEVIITITNASRNIFIDCLDLNNGVKLFSDKYIQENVNYFNNRRLNSWNIKYNINNSTLQNNNFIPEYFTYFSKNNNTLTYYYNSEILLNYNSYLPTKGFDSDSILNYNFMLKQTIPFVGITDDIIEETAQYCILANKLSPADINDFEYKAILCKSDKIENTTNIDINNDLTSYNNIQVAYCNAINQYQNYYKYIFNCISPAINKENIFPIYTLTQRVIQANSGNVITNINKNIYKQIGSKIYTDFYIKIDNSINNHDNTQNNDICIFYSPQKQKGNNVIQLFKDGNTSNTNVITDYVVNIQSNEITSIKCKIELDGNTEEIYFTDIDGNEYDLTELPATIQDIISTDSNIANSTKFKIFKYLYKTNIEIDSTDTNLSNVSWDIIDCSNFVSLDAAINTNDNYAYTFGTKYIIAAIENNKILESDINTQYFNAYLINDDIPCDYNSLMQYNVYMERKYSSKLYTSTIDYAYANKKTAGIQAYNDLKLSNTNIFGLAYNLKTIVDNNDNTEYMLNQTSEDKTIQCADNVHNYTEFSLNNVVYNGIEYSVYTNNSNTSYGYLFNFLENVENNTYKDNYEVIGKTTGATYLFGKCPDIIFYNTFIPVNPIDVDRYIYQVPYYKYTFIEKIANIGSDEVGDYAANYITHYLPLYFSKGNILYMCDEYNNEANYDIINTLFKRSYNNMYLYTISTIDENNNILDSINNTNNSVINNKFITNKYEDIDSKNTVIFTANNEKNLVICNNYILNSSCDFINNTVKTIDTGDSEGSSGDILYITDNTIRSSSNISFTSYNNIESNSISNCNNIFANGNTNNDTTFFNNSLILGCNNKRFYNDNFDSIYLLKDDDTSYAGGTSPKPLFSFENFKILSNDISTNTASGYNAVKRKLTKYSNTSSFSSSIFTSAYARTNYYNSMSYVSNPTSGSAPAVKDRSAEYPNTNLGEILNFKIYTALNSTNAPTSKISGIYGANKKITFGNIHTYAGAGIYTKGGQSRPNIIYNLQLNYKIGYYSGDTFKSIISKDKACSGNFDTWSKGKWTTYYGQIIFNCGIDLSNDKFSFVPNDISNTTFYKIMYNNIELGQTLNANKDGDFILYNIGYKVTLKSFNVRGVGNNKNIGYVHLGEMYHDNDLRGNKILNEFTTYNYTTTAADNTYMSKITYFPAIITPTDTTPMTLICNDGILFKTTNDTYSYIIPGEAFKPVKPSK